MVVLLRTPAPLLVLCALAGCGAEEPASPAGTWTTTITVADEPPSDRPADSYRLELGTDGRYVLEGAGFTAHGGYVVDGDALELRDDDRCEAGSVGRYEWAAGRDGALVLTAQETDPCDQPLGGRQFVLTRHPWSPAAG